ncbi:MAG: hypothetical protein HPY79_11010 [Bacteroidales bacterium]|nr:hypothetical protein [Bacteroidales bacterium]
MKRIITIFIVALTFYACIEEWDKALDKKVLINTWVYSNNWINENNSKLEPSVLNSNLEIEWTYKDFNKLKDSILKDTNNDIQFYLRFFDEKGHIIMVPNVFQVNPVFNKYKASENYLMVRMDPTQKEPILRCKTKIPFILLSQLYAGNNKLFIELLAYEMMNQDSIVIKMPIHKIKARWQVFFEMPEINEIYIYTAGIYLQNDEKFSPVGMDFSFREGLPDIYWTIFANANDKNDFSNYYWRSNEVTYAYNYTDSDTVVLYTTSPNEKVILGVYDRDDFSHDDFIGDWFGKISDLFSNDYKVLTFDHIHKFYIKAKFNGCINKIEPLKKNKN